MSQVTLTESIRRLNVLKDYLATSVDPKRFNMGNWAQVYQPVASTVFTLNHEAFKAATCGTAACALGHAAMIPEFQDLGLRGEVECSYNLELTNNIISSYDIYYEDFSSRDAGQAFFGISIEQANRVFIPDATQRGSDYWIPLGAMKINAVVNNIEFVIKEQQLALMGVTMFSDEYHTQYWAVHDGVQMLKSCSDSYDKTVLLAWNHTPATVTAPLPYFGAPL